MQRKNLTKPRRAPTQQRSEETIEAILVAADEVITRTGFVEATTKEVATVANVSVGTLYRYFPSKDALLKALIERAWKREVAGLGERITPLIGLPLKELVEAVVRVMMDAVTRGLGRYGKLDDVEQSDLLHTAGPEMVSQAATFVAAALERRRDELWPTDLHLAAIVIVRVTVFMARVGNRDHRETMESGALQDEVAQMVSRYLVKPTTPT